MAKMPAILIDAYIVLTTDTPEGLETSVREKMAQGWQPMGGVAVALSESDEFRYVVYAQAMIRIHLEG